MNIVLAFLVGIFTLIFRLNIDSAPNFSPVLAICLFSTFLFKDKSLALLAWMVPMLISDYILGWYPSAVFVYGSLALITFIGISMKSKKTNIVNVFLKVFSASVLFFVLSNFGVWLLSGMYKMTSSGLLDCYLAAVPFFRNTLTSTLVFYSSFMFLSLALKLFFQKDLVKPV